MKCDYEFKIDFFINFFNKKMTKQKYTMYNLVKMDDNLVNKMWNIFYDDKTHKLMKEQSIDRKSISRELGFEYDDGEYDEYVDIYLNCDGILEKTKANLLKLLMYHGVYNSKGEYTHFLRYHSQQYNMYEMLINFKEELSYVIIDTNFADRLMDKYYMKENPFGIIKNVDDWISMGDKVVIQTNTRESIEKEFGRKFIQPIIFKCNSSIKLFKILYRLLDMSFCHFNIMEPSFEYLSKTLLLTFDTQSH